MPKNTFMAIQKIIRFDDVLSRRQQRSTDKFAPIRELWTKWEQILPMAYNPHSCVTVDEQLLGFHGRCKFRQYMPSKPERYGLKFWLLVCSESCYIWKIQPYLGKFGETAEKNQGERVVMDLVDGLKGHNVTMDNFFTSYSLGLKLIQKDLTMVGTLRKNKKCIPPKLLIAKNMPLYSSTFAFTKEMTLVSYISHKNKCTLVLSTMHNDKNVENDAKKRPEIISFYNSTKGGVDTVDKMLSCYSTKRKCNRWPMAVFSNIIDISALNAFILFKDVNPEWKTTQKHKRRKCFLHELALALAKNYIQKRRNEPKNEASIAIVRRLKGLEEDPTDTDDSSKERLPHKRRRCNDCYNGEPKQDKKTFLYCSICKKAICKDLHAEQICKCCLKKLKI